jgi:sugar phosphate isomerase/epimerase
MSIKNGIRENVKLAATITASVSPKSPVVMGGDPAESIRKVSELGYDAVVLHWGDPSQIELGKITAACEKHGMTISAFATGRAYTQEGLSLIDRDEVKREYAIQRLFDYVDAASPFHSTVIIGCIRGNLSSDESPEYCQDILAQSTRIVAEYAAEKNVPIVFEAINRFENNYLNSAQETLDFINRYRLPNTRILLDTFHMNIEDADMSQAIKECGNMLGYVHFADSNRYYVGAGHIDYREIVSALKAVRYEGVISAECLPLPDPDTAAKKWIEGVRKSF